MTFMRIIVLFISLLVSFYAFNQNKITLSGSVSDVETESEQIFDARIVLNNTIIAKSDIDGNYKLQVDPNQTYSIKVTSFGYDTLEFKLKVGNTSLKYDITLAKYVKGIDEVIVKADAAKTRETPIAFSKLTAKQISEDLGTRDLPMILNSTPGAYATEQGGGAGDARVSIRGFDQRNIAVLVDGVPVNDMENGQVYWSNWDGLSDITRYMQVQRGLGASKLSLVSVGGTMNVVTKGIDAKMGASFKQEVNDYGLFKSAVSYNTGLLKGNWGVTVAGSKKWGSSFADATFTDAYSYFIKVQKKYKKHLFSLGVNGAPQSHGQRTARMPIAVIDKGLAEKAGINYQESLDSLATVSNSKYTTPTIGARGIRYNPNSGIINGEIFNERVNFFHKPQINFTHSYNPSPKFNLTNVLYLSIASGGGTGLKTSLSDYDTTNGLLKLQKVFDYNSTAYSSLYSTTENVSSNYLRASHNDHMWYGILSTINYKINSNWTSMFGIDARYYRGSHYQSVYDLMGGDYVIDNTDENQQTPSLGNTSNSMKRVGDKIAYNNDATVKWGGVFGQVEYKKDKWSTFVTASINTTGYQRIDFFKKKDLVIDGVVFAQAVGYGDTMLLNGTKYTINSAEARAATTDEKWFTGATIKGGANYNINKNHNVFFNIGHLNIAPRMNTVFDNANRAFLEIKNQEVNSIEFGYGYKSKRFSSNVNVYYTIWKNKPPQFTPTTLDGDSYNINGLDALHKGIELDFIFKITPKIDFEGLASIADWRTTSGNIVTIVDQDNNIIAQVDFSAKDVHVGDAAQVQLGGSLRFEIKKDFYVKLRYTYFDKNYANFDPVGLVGANKDRESWMMPSYGLLDFNFGYEIKVFKKYFATLSGGVMNVLNEVYITDAQNGLGFDARTANVFVGMGRRFNVGLKIGF
jgi:outer membrane cobalamin receptor